MSTTGFEYKNKHGETPFETFLRYTDEKKKSAAKLATILQPRLTDGTSILDIGTGNGEYLDLALSHLDRLKDMQLTLVEPSHDLTAHLFKRFERQFPESHLHIINSDLESFDSKDTFDVVLMSHLFYHVPRPLWASQLAKALSLLKQGGVLIIVLREKDDAYDFKMAFKPLLFAPTFKALTIDDVLNVLPKRENIQITKELAASELHIPFEDNPDDTISIIEFYLNKEWTDIPKQIQQASLMFISQKKGIFKQKDAIAVLQKA
jgi:SAM-dependent methyltransferase